MCNKDIPFQLALRQVPNIGDIQARILLQKFGSAEAVFNTPVKCLEKTEGIGTIRARSIKNHRITERIYAEIDFCQKYGIAILLQTDEKYPKRLLQCNDAPFVLFAKGNADLNAKKMVGIVGTRANTEYGKHCCEQLIADLSQLEVTIVSGLAYGIDTIAHKQSLKQQLPTIAVLAHGLDTIYPANNRNLATAILENGTLLTEYLSGTPPDKQNFPGRNRITAGLCDALVVVETGKKGGSLITADLALGYHRDVFAFPGRATDLKSEGCNNLIAENKAQLITSAEELVASMLWGKKKKSPSTKQSEMFQQLTESELQIFAIIEQQQPIHIDNIRLYTQLTNSLLANTILSLEIKGIVRQQPGNHYTLN